MMASTFQGPANMLAMLLFCLSFMSLQWQIQGSTYEAQGRAGGKRTIALLDSLAILDTHSIFFAGLAARGHKLTYALATSPRVTLFEYGQPLYDNVVYFAPTTTVFTAPGLEGSQTLADFVAQGGNLIMAADVDMSDLTREIASEFGVDFDKKRTVVMDHFSHAPALDLKGLHTNVVSSNLIENEKILGPVAGRKGGAAPVVFRGVGHIVDPENILAVPILSGMSSTYSAAPLKEIPAPSLASARLTNAGTTLGLISGVQGRNNARATISGSLDFFSDAYFQHTLDTTGQLAGNELVALEMSKWAFGERGILRASNVTHHRADGSNPEHLLATKEKPDLPFSLFPDPELNRQSLVYRIKDDIIYSLVIEEYDADRGGWVPYQASDVQLEFVMLDPHIRTFLECVPETGRFWKLFKVPDNYGIFKFRILYRRPGLSVLAVNTQVSVRPFHHDEYERFIFSAFPYYASAFSMMAGFLVFGVALLYSKPQKGDREGKSLKKE